MERRVLPVPGIERRCSTFRSATRLGPRTIRTGDARRPINHRGTCSSIARVTPRLILLNLGATVLFARSVPRSVPRYSERSLESYFEQRLIETRLDREFCAERYDEPVDTCARSRTPGMKRERLGPVRVHDRWIVRSVRTPLRAFRGQSSSVEESPEKPATRLPSISLCSRSSVKPAVKPIPTYISDPVRSVAQRSQIPGIFRKRRGSRDTDPENAGRRGAPLYPFSRANA